MSYIDDLMARELRSAERMDRTLKVIYDILDQRQQPELEEAEKYEEDDKNKEQ